MIVIHVAIVSREGAVREIEEVLQWVVNDATKLPGCVRYEWYRVPGQARRFVAYGEFRTRADFEEYLKSTIVRRIREELIPLLSGPPSFRHYEATVFASDEPVSTSTRD